MTLLESALQEVNKGPEAVNGWLAANPEALEPAFIDEASDFALNAMRHGALPAALATYMLTTLIQMRRGNRKGALRSKLQEVEVLYMLAETPAAYEQAYELARMAIDKARGEDLPAVAFWGTGLAADSAYWCSTVVADAAVRKRWLRAALEELTTIERPPAVDESPGPWERFVSGLVAVYQTVTGEDWGPDQDDITAALRELAALVERIVPVDYGFDDPQKTAHVAHHLADLSARFGDRAAADARQRAVQQSVKSDEWG